MKKKICYFSGKRGGFGALLCTLEAISREPEFELQIVVGDMHTSAFFGNTRREVEKHFPIAATINMGQRGDSPLERTQALGACLSECASVFERLKPDLLLVLGDRGETLAAATAAVNLGIPVCHVEGGDTTGNLDDWFRHAITKLSHLHLVAHEDAYEKVRQMGEDPRRIHIVGDAHLDLITNRRFSSAEEVSIKYGISWEKYAVVLYHPETLMRKEDPYLVMRWILQELVRLQMPAVVIYPCSDQGYGHVVRAIEEFASHPLFSIHKNIEAGDFLGLLSGACCMIGNSSAGIKETPLFRIPTLNVGLRQKGRKTSENVMTLHFPDQNSIQRDIEDVLNPSFASQLPQTLRMPYGEGRMAERTLKILKNLKFGPALFQK